VPFRFGLTMFVSATLLFLVQPMVGKMILPLLGGTPAVWNTCMVFFQALLLAGYAYAHKVTDGPAPKSQVAIHGAILIASIAVLALAAALSDNHSTVPIVKSIAPQGSDVPFFGVLALLMVAIGIPFFTVTTTAPLLQKWFSETGHPSAKDPYFLYAASNAGSLLSLMAYPIFVEPNLRVVHQAWLWTVGFFALAVMILWCGAAVRNAPKQVRQRQSAADDSNEPAPSLAIRIRWLILAAVPSSLMLAMTTQITTDIISMPLLWIVPLALYLLTFVLVFSTYYTKTIHMGTILITPVAILLLVYLKTANNAPVADRFKTAPSFKLLLLIEFATMFLVTMTCHGELARTRPSAKYLTNFYLTMSFGGMIGGIFNALVAPIVFVFITEYPITLLAACAVLPKLSELMDDGTADAKEKSTWELAFSAIVPVALAFAAGKLLSANYGSIWDACRWVIDKTDIVLSASTAATIVAFGIPALLCYFLVERPKLFAATVGALWLGSFTTVWQIERNKPFEERTYYTRSYFGTLKVETYIPKDESGPGYRRLVHGTTLHGLQILDTLRTSMAAGVSPFGAADPFTAYANQLVADDHYRYPGRDPMTYYHRTGPVGHMFRAFEGKLARGEQKNTDVACIGLGTGSLASYGKPGQKLSFFEIDWTVRNLVEPPTYFTYIDESKKQGVDIEFLMGDARLTLEQAEPNRKWGFMLVDAFSSDSIPAHLLTVESVQLYFDKLEDNGIVALHISNRYLNLEPVVQKIVKKLGYSCRVMHDRVSEYDNSGKTSSTWVAVAKTKEALGPILTDPEWGRLMINESIGLWTDDFTPIKSVLMGDWSFLGMGSGRDVKEVPDTDDKD
jgi:hypothetical protein